MPVDGGRAGVQPDCRRMSERSDDLAQDARGVDARVEDVRAIRGVVTAIDGAAGKVDADVGAVQQILPIADVEAVPANGAPGRWGRTAAEDGDVVALRVEVASQHRSDLPRSAGDDDAH